MQRLQGPDARDDGEAEEVQSWERNPWAPSGESSPQSSFREPPTIRHGEYEDHDRSESEPPDFVAESNPQRGELFTPGERAQIEFLLAAGFGRERSLQALLSAEWNLERAVKSLVSEGPTVTDDSMCPVCWEESLTMVRMMCRHEVCRT